jgi:pimeloyl-ACP methyl ester carboxylesterase
VVPDLVTSDHVRLSYVCTGPDDAPRLVLLHGLGSDAEASEPLVEAVGGALQIVRLDLRGHGRSERLDDPARYGWFGRAAADVVELMDALQWDDASVAGGSLGAATAVAVALGYPERLRRLGVFAPAFGAGVGGANETAQGLFAAVEEMGLLGVLGVLENLPEPPAAAMLDEARENWGRQDDAAIRACVTALTDAVLLDDLADLDRVDVPALVVGHGGDPLHPWELAEAYAANLPHARLERFDDYTAASGGAIAALVREFFGDL